jgi:nicotinamidase-related amidase
MTELGVDELEVFRAGGFGQRIGPGRRPAVLAVDLMVGFTDPSLPLGSDLEAELAASAEVLRAARAAGALVLHTVVRYDDRELADAGIWMLKQKGLASLRAGTPAVETDPRVAPLGGEGVIVKKYASAFFGTDLVSRLNAGGVDTLLLVGCTTSGCIRASAIDAVQYGFRPLVVREAVGDRTAAAHAQSLFDLEQKYADVVSLADAVSYLGSLPASFAS